MTIQAPAHRKLLVLQKRIFNSLRSEADRLLGETPAAIRAYERRNARDFSAGAARGGRSVDKDDLIRSLREADVSFIADFHTYNQAQRTALRLMREAVRPGEHWWVGLELIPSQFQPALDRFQRGDLSKEKFLEEIRYDEQWGFPWSNYAPIFEWARENSVRLIALNRPKALVQATDDRELHERDVWAAGVITDLFHDHVANAGGRGLSRPRMLVLYGDLHVGRKHLPTQLTKISRAFMGKPLRSLTVHQNHDASYWRLAREGRELQTEILRLREDCFCVFSGTPWGKLQSLVSWAEGGVESAADDADEDSGGETDYLAMMRAAGGTIAEFLDVEPAPYESLTVRTIHDADFLNDVTGEHAFTRAELSAIRFHVVGNLRLHIPRLSVAYLGAPSQNGAAELAAVHLQRFRARTSQLFERTEADFYRLVLEGAFGFLGSLILNPRRKCDLPQDHLKRLAALEKGEKASFSAERDARRLTLAVLDDEARLRRGSSRLGPELAPFLGSIRLAPAAMLAARMAGYVLAKRLHGSLLQGDVAVTDARTLLAPAGKPRPGAHLKRYLALLEAVEDRPAAESKTQSL